MKGFFLKLFALINEFELTSKRLQLSQYFILYLFTHLDKIAVYP